MAIWKTVMMYKKFAILRELRLNTRYNIEEESGMVFKDPSFFYTVSEMSNGNGITYKFEIEYVVEYPFVTFYNKYANYDVSALLYVIVYDKGRKYYDD